MFSWKKPIRTLGDFVSVLKSGDIVAGTCLEVNTPFGVIHEVVVTAIPNQNFDKQSSEIGDQCLTELGRFASVAHGVRFSGLVLGYIAVVPDADQPKQANLVYVEKLTHCIKSGPNCAPREILKGRLKELTTAMDYPLGAKSENVISRLITSPVRTVR